MTGWIVRRIGRSRLANSGCWARRQQGGDQCFGDIDSLTATTAFTGDGVLAVGIDCAYEEL